MVHRSMCRSNYVTGRPAGGQAVFSDLALTTGTGQLLYHPALPSGCASEDTTS